MFYYLYEIRNNINGKIYVGVHKTKVINDGYMGSGKVIKSAIEKNGVDNFTKTILEHFDSSEAMYAREKEVVTEEFLNRDDTYNLRRGGSGGFDFINKHSLGYITKTKEQLKLGGLALSHRIKNDEEFAIKQSTQKSKRLKECWKTDNPLFKFTKETNLEFGKRAHSQKAKEKRQKTWTEIGFQRGEKNSQYGTAWVWHDLFGNKKVQKEFVVDYIDQGWSKTYKPGYRIQS